MKIHFTLLALSLLAFAGCEQSPEEKRAEAAEEAAENAQEAIERRADQTKEAIEERAERTQEQVEQAAEQNKERVERAAEQIENGAEQAEERREATEERREELRERREEVAEEREDLAESRQDLAEARRETIRTPVAGTDPTNSNQANSVAEQQPDGTVTVRITAPDAAYRLDVVGAYQFDQYRLIVARITRDANAVGAQVLTPLEKTVQLSGHGNARVVVINETQATFPGVEVVRNEQELQPRLQGARRIYP